MVWWLAPRLSVNFSHTFRHCINTHVILLCKSLFWLKYSHLVCVFLLSWREKKQDLTMQDNYKLERKLRTTPYSENQTIELTRRNERKPMFKSLKAPYQHSDLTQRYLGIEYQSAKEACKDNQLTP